MKNSEIYTLDELELFDQIENGEYISLSKDEFEKEKALLIQSAKNLNEDLEIFEQRKHEKSISLKSFIKTLKKL